jgi:hypothetical protein
MIRITRRPSIAHGTLPRSRGFLLSEPQSTTGTRLSEVMGISPESVNRFRLRESSEATDWFNPAKLALNREGDTWSVDDRTFHFVVIWIFLNKGVMRWCSAELMGWYASGFQTATTCWCGY